MANIYKVNGVLVYADADQLAACCCCPSDCSGSPDEYTYDGVTCWRNGCQWVGSYDDGTETTTVTVYCDGGGSWGAHVVVTTDASGCNYQIYTVADYTAGLGRSSTKGSPP